MSHERFDVVIIGAGWYGLIAATTYLKLAPDTKLLIIDNGKSIGGVWNKERIYPNLFAQVGHGLFEYSFYPMKKEGLTPDRYISGGTIHNYLYEFSEKFGLSDRIWLETNVKTIKRITGRNCGWRLTIEGRLESGLIAEKLIVASGVSSDPYIPHFPNRSFTKPIIHSSQIGTSLDEVTSTRVKRVVILGAAKSAYDAVFLMLKSGKEVHWIIRADGSGPLAIMPPNLLGFLNTVDVMATRFLACFSPAILQTEGVWYRFLQRSFFGRRLTLFFWRTLTRLAEMHAGYSRTQNAENLRPIPTGFGIFWANSGLGLSSVPNFWKVFHAGDVTVHRTSITSFVDNKVNLADGTNIAADLVVLCTGWTDNLSTFEHGLRAEIGLPSNADFGAKWSELDAQADAKVDELLPNLISIPHTTPASLKPGSAEHRPWRLYRRLVSPAMANAGDRSIFFPGQIHSVFTPLVAELQALWGVAFLLGKLPVPSLSSMQEEVALWNSWTRKRYLAQGQKHAYSIYDYLAYIDTLARDLGIKTNRKSNVIAEMFSSYRPSDYRGLIDEYLNAQNPKYTSKPRSSLATLFNFQIIRSSVEETVKFAGLLSIVFLLLVAIGFM